MRRVNRMFNAAATPYRFSELRIFHTVVQTRLVGKPGLNPLLGYVQHAFFNSYTGLPDEEELLRRMFSQMPRLESLRYDGKPLTPVLVQTLVDSCPRLESLDVEVQGYHFFHGPDNENRLDLRGFRDLRELTLHNPPADDHDWWIPNLARLLGGSPRLQRLALGFRMLPRRDDAFLYENKMAASMHAWDRLCDLFARQGRPPLHLESLWFMGRLYPLSLSSLEKLTDLTYLRDVYVSNSLPPYSHRLAYSHSLELDMLALEPFAPPHAPNLRCFRVDAYSEAVHNHLCRISDPSFTRNLAIFYRRQHSQRTGFDPAALFRPSPEHPHLPLQVRMIDLDLDRAEIRHHNGAKIYISADQVLADLASTSADSLEGLAVRIPGMLANEKDRTARHYMALKQEEKVDELEYAIDAEPYLQSLERALAKLPKLTQLSVQWDGAGNKAVAERLALAGPPSLRFIHIYMWLWRVWRNDDGTVRLERVKNREVDRIELWRYSIFVDSPINRWHWRQ